METVIWSKSPQYDRHIFINGYEYDIYATTPEFNEYVLQRQYVLYKDGNLDLTPEIVMTGQLDECLDEMDEILKKSS